MEFQATFRPFLQLAVWVNRITLILIVLIFFPAILPFGTNGINLMEIVAFIFMPFSIGYFFYIKKL